MKSVSEMLNQEPPPPADDSQVDHVPVTPDNDEPEAQPPAAPAGANTQAPSPEARHEDTIPLRTFKDLERQLREAKSQLKQREVVQPVEVPDVLADQEGFRSHLLSEAQQTVFNTKVELAEEFARDKHADFADVMGTDDQGHHKAWIDLLQAQPHLWGQFQAARNPPLFAYEAVKRHRAMSDIGDPLTYEERLTAKIRAQVEAEFQKKQTPAPEIPDTLADEPSKSPRKGPEWSGPKPLKDIIGAKKK